jgi:hypothetical protein
MQGRPTGQPEADAGDTGASADCDACDTERLFVSHSETMDRRVHTKFIGLFAEIHLPVLA